MGKVHAPAYRVVVVDSRKKRDGRVIEEIGVYDAQPDPSVIRIDSERAQYWLGVGAQPSEADKAAQAAQAVKDAEAEAEKSKAAASAKKAEEEAAAAKASEEAEEA